MIVLKLVRVYIFFALSAGPFFLMPNQLYAGLPIWCCPCGTECSWLNLGSWFCECRGRNPGCPYCDRNDHTMIRAKSFDHNGVSETEFVADSVSSAVTNSALTASMIEKIRGGKCIAKKHSLRLLANAVDGFKLEPASFNDNSIGHQILTFHGPAEK